MPSVDMLDRLSIIAENGCREVFAESYIGGGKGGIAQKRGFGGVGEGN